MTVESATSINDLNTSYPANSDAKSEGAAHIRLVKTLIKAERGLVLTSKSTDYTFVLADANNSFLHPAADTSARTWTIPANASVAYPAGTVLTFVNENAAGAITLAITSDTLRLAGTTSTGSRTLAANGMATAIKISSTVWYISGAGLT